MRNRTSSTEHAAAVSRRLALLGAELATVRGDPPSSPRPTDEGRAPMPDGRASPAPTGIPLPGRHAHRRAGAAGPGGRLRISPAHLAVLALLLAVGLAVTAWVVVRSAAEPAALPTVEPAGQALVMTPTGVDPAAESGAGSAGGTVGRTAGAGAGGDPAVAGGGAGGRDPAASVGQEVTVDVAGKVRRPGIAVLPAGSRVVDAIEAAGGARRGVDLTSLNLARVLVDGEQVLVGTSVPASAGVAGSVPPATGAESPLVDINTADQATLETLPGVGPVTATAIIDWRTEHGGFTSLDELLEVDGIGEATLDELAPHVTI